MDSRSTAAEPNQSYQPVAPCWSRIAVNGTALTTPRTTPGSSTPNSLNLSEPAPSYPPNLDLLAPLLFSQHQAQLLHYNKLVAPGRGGGFGHQCTSLAGLPPVPNIQAAPRSRSRSSSKVSNKDGHSSKQPPAAQNCHGTEGFKNFERQDREGMTMEKDKKDTTPQDKGKTNGRESTDKTNLKPPPDMAHVLPSRPAKGAGQAHQLARSNALSNSVPNTPHQRARNSSLSSRDPSPTATQIPSPRSIYSEPPGGVASLSLPSRPHHQNRACRFETAPFQQQRRMPYVLVPGCTDKVNLDTVKSNMSDEEERTLTKDMERTYERLIPSRKVEENREKLVKKLQGMFNDEWPGHNIWVHLFGSSGNLLCSDDSDVDICITTDWKEMEGVCIIADLLARRGMQNVVCVAGAKVPIVKIWDPQLKLHCDMNVNNTLALENTRMIRTYVEIDERVRPLAMVIKYWTRRRMVNDAAHGATLSSYTWICMIIAFLQLRDPPVLPALHQMQQYKLPTTDGHTTQFADDLNKLKGWGTKNNSSLGELLFQFFRFFAYEFDYDNQVLSVRQGKVVYKKEKTEREWQHPNNYICVEEPFNTVRNLGNTADEFSFHGLLMEMRRAFALIGAAKLDECCEQYVFPKHEPTESKAFVKPPQRPIMVRSSSQTQPSRGGRHTGRGNRTYRNGNSSRRASSSNAYENAPTSAPGAAPAPIHSIMGQAREMSAADLQPWQFTQHFAYPANAPMLSSALQTQQERLNQNWFAQQQQQAHLHAAVQAQRAQNHAASSGRSRTNSFDQPPLTAPPRPEYFAWPTQLQLFYAAHAAQAAQQYQAAGYGTYPSSPSATAVPAEFRRSLHRANAANDGGSSNNGTLRSQSQPASRTPAPGGQPGPSYAATAQIPNGASGYSARQSNLSPFPAFAPPARTNSEADDTSTRTLPDSPPENDSPGNSGFFGANSTARKVTRGVPILQDVPMSSSSRRRLSTDGPQQVLDRRLRRTSRSPSPAGHGRNASATAHSAPLASATFAQKNHRSAKESSPLVVNGSTVPPAATGSLVIDDATYDNPLHISQGNVVNGATVPEETVAPTPDRPLVANGSSPMSPVWPRNNGAMPTSGTSGQGQAVSVGPNGVSYAAAGHGDQLSNKGRAVPRTQSGLASLDLAVSNRLAEPQHLSPVYEHRTPTPIVSRDRPFNLVAAGLDDKKQDRTIHKTAERNGAVKEAAPSTSSQNQTARTNGHAPREHGPVRTAKVEAEWQQAKPRKSKSGKVTAQSEKPPKDLSERKGG